MTIYTSYFAKLRRIPYDLAPISISLWPPKGYNGLQYKPLAPSPDILREYKQNPDWKRYTARFNGEILAKLDPNQVVTELAALSSGRDIVLCCFERDRAQCHRSLVGEWLGKAGYNVEEWTE